MAQRKLHPDPKAEDRFHEILGASLRLFAQYGYEKTSIDRIAKDIKATKGLVYYYFRSKEDILSAMTEAFDFRPAIAHIGAIDASIPLAQAVSLLIRGSIRVLDSRSDYIRFLYTEGQFLDRKSESLMRSILGVWADATGDFLKKRMDAGELRTHDTSITAQHLTDVILAYYIRTRVVHPALRKKTRGADYFNVWIETFLHGLAPAAAGNQTHQESRIFTLLRNADGLTPEVILALAPALFHQQEAGAMNMVISLRLLGQPATDHAVTIRSGKLEIHPGKPAQPDLGFELSVPDFISLSKGEMRAADLYFTERLRIHGSLDEARKLGRLFRTEGSAAVTG